MTDTTPVPHSLLARIGQARETVIDLQRKLVAIPALGPRNGGQGEKDKADFLVGFLKELGLTDIRELRAPDDSVECGYRPTLAARLPGRDTGKTLWIISHTDVVPPGDLDLWDFDPYELQVDGDVIMGRGVEDNHQGLVSSVVLAKALIDLDITPDLSLGLLMVADEETASRFGLEWVLEEHGSLFGRDDLFLVPDFGDDTGEMVEVAEKSMLWLKITVQGKQCHGSTPDEGVNSLVAAADLILRITTLGERFPDRDPLFSPDRSTFEPTKKEANVANINTIPGRDVFSVDCRVLPQYDLDEVLAAFRSLADEVEAARGVTIRFKPEQREQAAPATPPDSEIVRRVMDAARAVYGIDPKPVGIGGGTVAAFLRRAGHPAVVWSRLMHNAHQPNEKSSIAYTLGDAQAMARMLFNG